MKSTLKIVIAIVAIVIIVGAVGGYVLSQSPSEATLDLTGAGATFPLPFLNATIVSYSSIKPNVQINYQGVGSGTGINSLINKHVDFAASDAPLNSNQTTYLPNTLHIPETIGAVTLAYNLPGISSGLKLTGDIIAKIYLGTITNWNDPAIVALNPDLTLPNHAITTVFRSDSSGTTNIFTKYLSASNSVWNTTIKSGTSVQWPGTNSVGAKGNSLVASTVSTTQYAIGYVELAYALQNHMTVASVQNPSGNYIAPSLDSTIKAVQSAATGLPTGAQSWSSVSLLNAPDAQAYPIVAFTYIIVYKDLSQIPDIDSLGKANAVVQYIWYVIHDGQSLAANLGYAALPANVVAIDETSLRSMTFNGQALTVG
jgi:phosphate transport system substrate-binding protein